MRVQNLDTNASGVLNLNSRMVVTDVAGTKRPMTKMRGAVDAKKTYRPVGERNNNDNSEGKLVVISTCGKRQSNYNLS